MKSIRFRVMGTYLAIIVITIILFGTGVYSFIRSYYFDSLESSLIKGQEICADIYNELYYQYDIETEAEKIGRRFIPYTRAQILLMNTSGKLLYDSTDTYYQGEAGERDLGRILDGGTVISREVTGLGERMLSVSRLLKSGDQEVGILKLSTSLEGVYRILNRVILILSGGGLVIVAVVLVIALLIANTITGPVRKITGHISAIASGDLRQRPGGRFNDELGAVTENLNGLSERLEENERLREHFIESVSHELRTPLTSIKGWIVTIKSRREKEPELLEEGLGIIENETDRLSGLVDDLLDFSGYASKAEFLTETDLTKLMDYVYRQMKPRAGRLGISLSNGSSAKKMLVRCDRDRIRQVLINLLDNALKYSRPGDSVYMVSMVEKGSAVIKVRDTGPGFDPADVERIFEKKYRGENTLDGRGLGLAISKEIIESHCGTIGITTGSGGTEVTLRIPVNGGGHE